MRSSFEAVVLPPRQLFLLDEQRQVILEGEIYVRLAPLLDGRRSLTDIASAATGDFALHDVLLALGDLEKRGCLVEGPPTLPEPETAWFDSLPGDPVRADEVAASRISVRALGTLSPDPMIEALAASGLPLGEPGDLTVVVTDDYLRDELDEVNRAALQRGRPFMLVRPVGMVAWIGPVFVPGVTGCWRCLAQRLRANRQMEKYILERAGPSSEPRTWAALPGTVQLALELAVTELRRWLVVPNGPSLQGRLLTVDLLTRAAREHVLVRRPQCLACGDPERPRALPPPSIVRKSCKKRVRADGGHRTVSAAETFERYKHHISPITGAVSELRPAGGRYDPELTPCYVAGHNFSMGVESVLFLKESLRGFSGGKGTSDIQAKVSGLCEAIERYSGIYWGDEYTQRGSYERWRPRAVHPNECMGFSDEQYRRREETTSHQPPSRYVMVPRPFDPAREIDWSPVWSLTRQEEKLMPTAYCYYGHPEFKDRWSIPDSNGCAAGNTLEEATLQGLLELVERDAVALWWYNRIRRPGVDLDSFDLPYVRALQEHYASLGRGLWVLDITSDLGITTLACVSARRAAPTEDVLVGFGSHLDPRVALLRAVTEVNQFLPSVSYAREDGTTLYLFGDDLAKHWWTTARVEELDYLTPDPGQVPRRSSDLDDCSTDDLADDVRLGVDRARRAGLEVLLLDQTRPDIGLSVVRVMAPGLCHFWRRLGFQRLREVPVAMGWLDRPLRPDELNPYTIFF